MVTKSLIIRVLGAVGVGLSVTAFAFLIAFSLLNFMLGCETWDESLWTETNSCITPSMILEGLTNE